VARTVTLEGKRRVVLFALRDIAAGEEIFYDYMFAPEHPDDIIPCEAGSYTCPLFISI